MMRGSLCRCAASLLVVTLLLAPGAGGSPISSADAGRAASVAADGSIWGTVWAVLVAVWVVCSGADSEEGANADMSPHMDPNAGTTTEMSPHMDPWG